MNADTQQDDHDAEDLGWEDEDGPLGPLDSLIIDVDGFEGPLDLLLTLARDQKVDITKISILALAEQYLTFIKEARKLRLELAADYLVMAAWLAYLKSRLLLPEPEKDDEPSGEELAALLSFRLQRLDAMRQAAAQLMARNRLGRDVFQRGDPESIEISTTNEYVDNLYDLLKVYAERRQRQVSRPLVMRRQPVWTIKEARVMLEKLLGTMGTWGRLDEYLVEYLVEPEMQATIKASTFSATLEMVREGVVDVRQEEAFAPIYLRRVQGSVA